MRPICHAEIVRSSYLALQPPPHVHRLHGVKSKRPCKSEVAWLRLCVHPALKQRGDEVGPGQQVLSQFGDWLNHLVVVSTRSQPAVPRPVVGPNASPWFDGLLHRRLQTGRRSVRLSITLRADPSGRSANHAFGSGLDVFVREIGNPLVVRRPVPGQNLPRPVVIAGCWPSWPCPALELRSPSARVQTWT